MAGERTGAPRRKPTGRRDLPGGFPDPDQLPDPNGSPRERRPWPYSVGVRGINRVRVYTREDAPEVIQIEWWDDRGRIQRSLSGILGQRISDRTLARDIAERVSAAQLKKRQQAARAMVFGHQGITLQDLLDQLHEGRGPEWSRAHDRDQRRYKDFWLDHLGSETFVHPSTINGPTVRQIVRTEAGKNKWKPRTQVAYLRYLKDALNFGKEQLKVLDDRHLLTDLEMPALQKVKGLAYSPEETARLLAEARKIDLRAYVVGEAYYQAGRRLTATRTLEAKAVRFAVMPTPDGPVPAAILSYPEETDKVGASGEVVLVGDVVGALKELLATPAVKRTGLLMPEGELAQGSATVGKVKKQRRGPIRSERIEALWRDIEEAAGIPRVKYRGPHGLKRRFASSSRGHSAATVQSGTTRQTLERTYDQDDELGPKLDLARALNRKLKG